MKDSLLWWVCVVLVATLQFTVKGQEFLSEDEVEVEEVVAEDDNEGAAGDGDDPPLDNMDDVLEEDNLCSRYSPKEVFHTVVNPHLFKIFDEMSTFVDASLMHIEAALHTLMTHVDQSPIGRLRVENLFSEVRTFMFGTMRDAYDVMRQAWRDLITTHVQKPASPQDTLEALAHVVETQSQVEMQLMASLQELIITLKAVVYNSIHVIQTSLNLSNNTDGHETAVAISRKLPKIAPNFLGTLISKVLLRGSDPSGYGKADTNPLRSVTPLVEKIHAELKAIIDERAGTEGRDQEEEEEEVMEAFWEAAMMASHAHLQEWPLLEEDLEFYYTNEEYLSELLLQLMATY